MSTTAEKMRLKPGDALHVAGADGRGLALLGPLPDGAHTAGAGEAVDAVVLFVTDAEGLRRDLPGAASHVPADGLIWVAYPKGGSGVTTDLGRDRLVALADEIAGLTGVTLISVDATWSAMRLRPSSRYRDTR